MKNLIVSILVVLVSSLFMSKVVFASDGCGELVEGKWNVQKAGDIKKHLKHRLKIEKKGNGKYSVKIKNDDGDTVFKSEQDFALTCSDNSGSAKLTGKVKMGNCVHALQIGAPYDPKSGGNKGSDNISIKFTADHDKGECKAHKDGLHDGDARKHSQLAYGKRAGG